MDPLKVDTDKEETNSKVTITAGYTDDDKCVRDEMLIAMTIKGEMTEEQKKQMMHDSVHGDCIKDIQNPQLQTKQGYVPKTESCIREAIKYTTMKKYTVNVSYKKVEKIQCYQFHIKFNEQSACKHTFQKVHFQKLNLKSIMKST